MTFDSVAESLMSLLAIRVLLVFNDKGNKEKLEQVQREIDLFESKFFLYLIINLNLFAIYRNRKVKANK